MPRSKHRRKPGAKAVRNPGRDKTPLPSWRSETLNSRAENAAWQHFKDAYREAVHQAIGDDGSDADHMADLISDAAFRFEAGTAGLGPASKADVFQEFTAEFELIDDTGKEPPVRQRRMREAAEATLAQLVAHALAEVEGDQITVPARFLRHEESQSPAPAE